MSGVRFKNYVLQRLVLSLYASLIFICSLEWIGQFSLCSCGLLHFPHFLLFKFNQVNKLRLLTLIFTDTSVSEAWTSCVWVEVLRTIRIVVSREPILVCLVVLNKLKALSIFQSRTILDRLHMLLVVECDYLGIQV